MDETTQTTPAPAPEAQPTWWGRLSEAFWYTGKGPVVALIVGLLCLAALAWTFLREPDAPSAEPDSVAEQVAPETEPQPDPIADLTERVIALEEETSRLAGLAHRPHGWTPASGQRPAPEPAPQPPRASPPPEPITRQSLDQYRATLRISQPDQE